MNIEPYADDVSCAGTNAPKADQIDDLLRLLATIRHRYGNTAIKYRVTWGGSAFWAEDAQRTEIDRLKKRIKRLQAKAKAAR